MTPGSRRAFANWAIEEKAYSQRRFGYRRLHILLKREGIGVNHKTLFRLYREQHMFRGLSAARRIIEEWRTDYNARRPHTSLGGLIPSEFATRFWRDHNENRVQF